MSALHDWTKTFKAISLLNAMYILQACTQEGLCYGGPLYEYNANIRESVYAVLSVFEIGVVGQEKAGRYTVLTFKILKL
jgi:hypothetical protein